MPGVDAPFESGSLRAPRIAADRWTVDDAAIDLWLAPLGGVTPDELATLSDDERARAARPSRRLAPVFAASRVVLRQVLSRYVGRAAHELEFRYGEHGRPALVESPGLDFNLSHSGSRVLIAVVRGTRVGVDLQRVEPDRDLRRLARRFFAPEEIASLEGLEGAAFGDAFFRLWCCKEAYLKALGTSISELPSGSFRFRFDEAGGAGPRLVESAWQAPGAEPIDEWCFALPEPPEGFVAAVGWTGEMRRLRVFGVVRSVP